MEEEEEEGAIKRNEKEKGRKKKKSAAAAGGGRKLKGGRAHLLHASNRTGGEEGGEGKLDCVTAARPHAPPTPWEGGIGKGRGIFKKPVHGKSGGLFLWRIMAALYIRKGGGGVCSNTKEGAHGVSRISLQRANPEAPGRKNRPGLAEDPPPRPDKVSPP